MDKSSASSVAQPLFAPDRAIKRVKRAALPMETQALARFLLGKIVVREQSGQQLAGRIVETEAYLHGEPACHAHRGPTRRNRTLFLRPGHAYVYLCYGTSFMLNVSSAAPGVGEGVLLRAIEPLRGIEAMQAHRGTVKRLDLARGPGRLAAALNIDLSFDGMDLTRPGPLWLGSDGQEPGGVEISARIGLTKAADLPLRFYVANNRYVSGPRRSKAAPVKCYLRATAP
jgi:DNA-3-methyladenine glycosylase